MDSGRLCDSYVRRKESSSKIGSGSKLGASSEAQCCPCPGNWNLSVSSVVCSFWHFLLSYCLSWVWCLVFLLAKGDPSCAHLTSVCILPPPPHQLEYYYTKVQVFFTCAFRKSGSKSLHPSLADRL